MAKANEAIVIYLQARYTVTNADATTLVRRYLDENPSTLNDTTKVLQALLVTADT